MEKIDMRLDAEGWEKSIDALFNDTNALLSGLMEKGFNERVGIKIENEVIHNVNVCVVAQYILTVIKERLKYHDFNTTPLLKKQLIEYFEEANFKEFLSMDADYSQYLFTHP